MKCAQMGVVAGITETIAALTTVRCPLGTVLTLGPTNVFVFGDAAGTKNLCWANRVLAPWATRHWSEKEVYKIREGSYGQFSKKVFSLFFLWLVEWMS
jgi:hypothetical protein